MAPRRDACLAGRAVRWALGALLATGLGAAAQPAAERPEAFLAQVACLDAGGAVRLGVLPFEPGCDSTRPLRVGEPLPYRKHDWPGTADAAAQPAGYQASDALLGRLNGAPAVLHTFDFGGGARRFGTFDAGAGDGGQAVLTSAGLATVALSEDGSGGVQWFLGGDCRPAWLLAGPATEEWQARLVRLAIAPNPQACPSALTPSLTRWRQSSVHLPWREAATGATGSFEAAVVVSEHYGGPTILAAANLERFTLARGLGLVRWERWENRARSRRPDIAAHAALIAGSQRCPQLASSYAPGPSWVMVDCRTWTNFVRATPQAPVAAMAWPTPGPQ